jgi:hypothetical protein
MADRIKFLIQKRTALKIQITNLANLLDKNKLDDATLKLRIARLTELYNAFEESHDELAVADPNDAHQEEFDTLQDRFFSLAGRIETRVNIANISGDGISGHGTRISDANSTMLVKKRRIKLPEAPLPTFDGKYENWLTFKNMFHNMIGSQTDLSDIDKLHYLKASLKGEASNKAKIFEIDGLNYQKAWELLERSYEVKRILVARHLSLILNLPTVEKENTSEISRLADDMQQHVASLNTLGVSVGSEMLVHVLESKIPKVTLEKWEATLDRDEYPTVDKFI